MVQRTVLPSAIADDLRQQAQAAPQREICGLISARHGSPRHIYPVANVSPAPQRRFEMEPAAQIAALRSMREQNETLYAIYHSHPRGAAVPSAEDRARAAYPQALYLIIAAETAELRGYRLDGDEFQEVLLEID